MWLKRIRELVFCVGVLFNLMLFIPLAGSDGLYVPVKSEHVRVLDKNEKLKEYEGEVLISFYHYTRLSMDTIVHVNLGVLILYGLLVYLCEDRDKKKAGELQKGDEG